MSYWMVVLLILAMLAIERVLITKTTRNPRLKHWFRDIWLLTPNGLSVMRLPMGIVSILLAHQGWWAAATLWFAFWMITDMTDGTIARNCDLVTEMGKWLDPLSDKFMYFPALVYFSSGNLFGWGMTILPFWLVVAFILLDTAGQLSRLWVQKKAANSFGKAKTALVTVVLSLISLNQISPLQFGGFVLLNEGFVLMLMVLCTSLAFLSFYCKVIPDQWYANTLILLNYLCGVASVFLCTLGYLNDRHNYYVLAFCMIFAGQFFDLFDGRLAQKFGSTANGDVFDEIADATAYGVGGTIMIFCCLTFGEELISWSVAACAGALYWGAILFNVFRFRHSSFKPRPGWFCGLPASAGAALAGSAVLFGLEFAQPLLGILSTAVVLLACLLMASKIPYKHFGLMMWPSIPRMLKLLVCILLAIFVCLTLSHRSLRFAFVCVSFLLSVAYAVFGADWRSLRHATPHTSTPQE